MTTIVNKQGQKKEEISYVITSVQPKPGFSIGNRNQGPIWVSIMKLKFSFLKPKLKFFSHLVTVTAVSKGKFGFRFWYWT